MTHKNQRLRKCWKLFWATLIRAAMVLPISWNAANPISTFLALSTGDMVLPRCLIKWLLCMVVVFHVLNCKHYYFIYLFCLFVCFLQYLTKQVNASETIARQKDKKLKESENKINTLVSWRCQSNCLLTVILPVLGLIENVLITVLVVHLIRQLLSNAFVFCKDSFEI